MFIILSNFHVSVCYLINNYYDHPPSDFPHHLSVLLASDTLTLREHGDLSPRPLQSTELGDTSAKTRPTQSLDRKAKANNNFCVEKNNNNSVPQQHLSQQTRNSFSP